MRDIKAYRTENKFTEYGVKCIDSDEEGLVYIVDGERKGVIVAGERGMTVLTTAQAKALANELSDIIDLMDLREV